MPHDIHAPRRRPPATHPHVAEVEIDPADHHRFHRLGEDRPETIVLDEDRSSPDRWVIRVACASELARERLRTDGRRRSVMRRWGIEA